MKIYPAAPFSFRVAMRELASDLKAEGHTVTASWLSEDSKDDDGDVRLYAEFWERDVADIKAADALLAYIPEPARMSIRGTVLVEIGVALALGKRVVIVSNRERKDLPLPAKDPCVLVPTFAVARAVLNCELKVESVVQEAHRLVHGDRGAAYGHPYDDYARTVGTFNALTGHSLSVPDGLFFMMCVKLSRERNVAKRDNLVDLAGYAECLHMVREREQGK